MYQLGKFHGALVSQARRFFARPLPYSFTDTERQALRPFFTNLDGHVFFFHNVPSNVCASTIARYSRLKNQRGIRGVWVDEILPHLLASQSQWVSEKSDTGADFAADFLKENRIRSLDDFVNFSPETENLFGEFLEKAAADPDYLTHFVDSKRARRLLGLFMDTYGHNSIARGAFVAFCCENISILAAKSLEWTRPATGIIELSTRYVEMSGAQLYPIWDELAVYGCEPQPIRDYFEQLFGSYRTLVGDEKALDGPLPSFFRKRYGDLIADAKDLERGVAGETFDLCGNLLPTAACTSAAIVCSGEAFPTILKHLVLDGTAENLALAKLIVAESVAVGGDQFARHYQPTIVDRRSWEYLHTNAFDDLCDDLEWEVPAKLVVLSGASPDPSDQKILELFALKWEGEILDWHEVAERLFGQRGKDRTNHDKLPSEFEADVETVQGIISWRGWRDVQRMSFAAHNRTLVTPKLGFYRYDKPAPPELQTAFNEAAQSGCDLYNQAKANGVPEFLLQYLLPLGFNVGYTFTANLREHEFCNWQRTKHDVNHEVRRVFLAHNRELIQQLRWWAKFSRIDQTPAYVFARSAGPDGKGVPLPDKAAV